MQFLITAGVGKFYSNGLDVHQEVKALQEINVIVHPFFVKLLTLPIVTIAAINGHALGLGAIIALAHDYRVMQKGHGWLSLPEARFGFSFPLGIQEMIRRKIGSIANERDLILFGKLYTAEEAQDCKLIDRACKRGAAVDSAIKFGEELVAGKKFGREIIQILKEDLYKDVIQLLMKAKEPRTLQSKL